jgi:SHS family lactate transporter-like MFS transporter
MSLLSEWHEFNPRQKNAFTASFLGWTLDAFDFHLMVFMLPAIAKEFGTDVKSVAVAVTLTLVMRPFGALVFGILADRFGRRSILMIDILLFSALEFASAFAPTLVWLLVMRAAFGFAMGGEWGLGASLTMETIPVKARGIASGILQEGYACGLLLAAGANYFLFDKIGWRGLFMVGVVPALLVLYIRRNVEESPAWQKMRQRPRRSLGTLIGGHGWLFLYVVVLMTAFNLLSHGTQDIYPTFLRVQRGYATNFVSILPIIGAIGAIIGGITFGRLSQRLGRRRAIIYATLFALPVIPLWAFGPSALWLAVGVFLMQIAVQGAWGVIPVHLNELSPDEVRGTFPAFAYQIGNMFAAYVITGQARYAESHGNNYALALAVAAAIAAGTIALLASVGREAHSVEFGAAADAIGESRE